MRLTLVVLVAIAAMAAGCGGGGSNGGGGGTQPPTLYAVGGSISGLAGSSLILNDGVDDLTVAANGSFVFKTMLVSGAAYDVKIIRQPLGFTSSCAINGGSGTVGRANVVDVGVSCHPAVASVARLAGSPLGVVDVESIAVSAVGDRYVASRNSILKISASGNTSVLAGGPTAGHADGTGTAARFNQPMGVAVDAAGIVYVADTGNHEIRLIATNGAVTTLAGNTTAGSADGTGSAATFNGPAGVAVDTAGNVYVADRGNNEIRLIKPTGIVSTLAGSTTPGFAEGTGATAAFKEPSQIVISPTGILYVLDAGNNVVRQMTTAGVVTPVPYPYYLFDRGTCVPTLCSGGYARVTAVAIDASGSLYVALDGHPYGPPGDFHGTKIFVTTPGGSPTALAGNVSFPVSRDGTGSGASFAYVVALAVDPSSNVLAADAGKFRTITTAGVTTTFPLNDGSVDGTGDGARFSTPTGVAVDSAGHVYIADYGNNEIRAITTAGVATTVAGSTTRGNADGAGPNAGFAYPRGVTVDGAGNLFVADTWNSDIRKITSAGVVSTVAGNAGMWGSSDGLGPDARFNFPAGIAVDTDGNVFVTDFGNQNVRKITPSGLVTTLAGSTASGNADGTGSTARFSYPEGIALDRAGNLYVADGGNNEIRKITPAGVVTTLAGSSTRGNADGTGSTAEFNFPTGITIDADGNLFVSDTGNNEIRKITPSGVVTTLAGDVTAESIDGIGSAASFARPSGIAVDAAGNLYVADSASNQIRKITPQ